MDLVFRIGRPIVFPPVHLYFYFELCHKINFNEFNNIRSQILDSMYHMTLKLLNLISGVKKLRCCHYEQPCYGHYFIMLPKYLIHMWFGLLI